MTINWSNKHSRRSAGLYGAMTRQLMDFISQPGVISFGGGLPAKELFPVNQVREICDALLEQHGPDVLQYGSSEGYGPLREKLAARYRQRHFNITPDNIIINTGSQQGIDLISKLLLDEGDYIIVEDPTFITALQSFEFYGVNYLTVPMDNEGMQVDMLPQILQQHDVKFIYTMPTFQNPTGLTLSGARRKKLIQYSKSYGVPVIEDDAYGELCFTGESHPALKSLDDGGCVIYLGSFSKILSPGLRVGFTIAPDPITEKLLFAKQSADLHSPLLSQRIADVFLGNGGLDSHIKKIIETYSNRCNAMLEAIESHFPRDCRWTRPGGGIFNWISLPGGLDTGSLLDAAVKQKVVYVPGSFFYANGGGENSMRLNFSACHEDMIKNGIERLANVIKQAG